MKKTFKKLLALFLTGTMLAGVGCKDYDDDIDNLQKEIDDLKSQIELKADASALESLKQKIDAIDFDSFLTAEDLAGYVTEDKLGTELSELLAGTEFNDKVVEIVKGLGYKTQEEIEAIVEGMLPEALDKEDIIAIFNEQLAAADLWTGLLPKVQEEIKNELASYSLNDSQQKQAVNAVLAAIDDKEDALGVRKAIANLLGEEFGTYMENYINSEWDVLLSTKVTEEIQAQLGDASKSLREQINEMISSSINSSIEEGALKTVFEEYDKKIAAIWSAIGDLASRIQSLVYVPTTQDGIAVFTSVALGDAKLTEGQKATMTFRVSPASLATALVEGYKAGTVELTFLPEKVTRAEVEPAFTIEGDVTAEDGKITMLVNSTYEYTDEATYSIALQVKEEKEATMPAAGEGEENTTIDTGVEFTSAYVPTKCVPTDVLANVALVKEVDSKYVEYNKDKGAEYSLEYDQTTVSHTLMGDYIFVYKNGETYMTFEEAAKAYNWDVVPSATPAITRTSFTTMATELSLTPAEPMKDAEAKATMVTVGLKKAEANNIDKTITEEGILAVTVGEEEIATSQNYKATLTITRKNLGTIEDLNTTINWVYANQAKVDDETQFGGYLNTNNAYTSAAMIVDGSKYSFLTNERYEQLKTALENVQWDVTGDIEGLTVTATADSDPYVGTDAKAIKYTVKGYKNGSSTVEVSTEINVANDAMITLKGTITFVGLPAEANYDITKEAAIFELSSGNLKIKVADDVNDIYEAVYEANFKGQTFFEDADEFKAFMASATNNFEAADVKVDEKKFAGLRYSESAPNVWAFFKQDMIDFEKNASYTYNVPVNDETAGTVAPALTIADVFAINFTGAITVNKDDNYYLGVGPNLYNGEGIETPYMIAKGTLTGSTFEVANVDLASGYYPVKPADSKANVVTTYTVQGSPAGYTGPMPTISNTTFDWNACQLDKVTVTATMTVDGLTVDVKTFEVILENPINIASWKEFATKEEKVTTNAQSQVNLYAVMNTKVNNTQVAVDIFGNNLMTNTSLAEAADAYGLKAAFGTPEYESTNGAETFDNFTFEAGVITYKANNAPLAGVVTVTVPVTFTYDYAIEFDGDAYVPVKYTKTLTVTFSNK